MAYYFQCPRCGQNDYFLGVAEQTGSTGCLILIFGGLLPAMLYESNRRGRIQCGQCDFIFGKPAMPQSEVAKLTTWIVGILLLALIVAVVLVLMPEFPGAAPPWLAPSWLVTIIAEHPRVPAIVLVLTLPVLLLTCLVAALVSNARKRRELLEMYPGADDLPDAAEKPARNRDVQEQ